MIGDSGYNECQMVSFVLLIWHYLMQLSCTGVQGCSATGLQSCVSHVSHEFKLSLELHSSYAIYAFSSMV